MYRKTMLSWSESLGESKDARSLSASILVPYYVSGSHCSNQVSYFDLADLLNLKAQPLLQSATLIPCHKLQLFLPSSCTFLCKLVNYSQTFIASPQNTDCPKHSHSLLYSFSLLFSIYFLNAWYNLSISIYSYSGILWHVSCTRVLPL